MLYYNAKFYTMKSSEDIAAGLLIGNDLAIERVIYSKKDVNHLLKKGIQARDLSGAFVYPGFVDTHTHSFEGGLYANAADLEAAGSIQDVLDILTAAEPINEIVVGYHLDENKLKEKRFPTIVELDKVFHDKPCLIRRIDGHSSVINSIAFFKAGIDKYINNIKLFNGVLRAELNDYMSGWFHKNIDREGIVNAYQKAANIAVARGHTAVHTMVGDGKDDIMHLEIIKGIIKDKPDMFPVDFVLYPQLFNIDSILDRKYQRVGGCVLADGSFGSGTAALSEPYSNSEGNYGILYKSDSEWYDFIQKAHSADMQVAIHCIGDRAIKQIVKAYSRVQNDSPKDLRHQVIHCELITDDKIIKMMADYNISAVMQPVFDKLWGGANDLYAEVLGEERAYKCNRLKSLYEAGVLVTGGSDWYVTEIDALAGIDAAVNLHNRKERLSPYQALKLYTTNPAKLINQEKTAGTLDENRQADFVCLERDIMTDDNIKSIPIKLVVKRGKVVYINS